MEKINGGILLISVKPQYAEKILSGEKTVELRKSAPSQVKEGSVILIYVTSPVKQLCGYCQVVDVIKESPEQLWKKVKLNAGVSKSEFFEYYKDIKKGYGIVIEKIRSISPIELNSLKTTITGFSPPQTYAYLSKIDIENVGLQCVLGLN